MLFSGNSFSALRSTFIGGQALLTLTICDVGNVRNFTVGVRTCIKSLDNTAFHGTLVVLMNFVSMQRRVARDPVVEKPVGFHDAG